VLDIGPGADRSPVDMDRSIVLLHEAFRNGKMGKVLLPERKELR